MIETKLSTENHAAKILPTVSAQCFIENLMDGYFDSGLICYTSSNLFWVQSEFHWSNCHLPR